MKETMVFDICERMVDQTFLDTEMPEESAIISGNINDIIFEGFVALNVGRSGHFGGLPYQSPRAFPQMPLLRSSVHGSEDCVAERRNSCFHVGQLCCQHECFNWYRALGLERHTRGCYHGLLLVKA